MRDTTYEHEMIAGPCLYCGQWVEHGRDESGATNPEDAAWHIDGDFGCSAVLIPDEDDPSEPPSCGDHARPYDLLRLQRERDTLRSSLSAVTRERDECAATARALRVELQAAESKWSAASRERDDAVALLRRLTSKVVGYDSAGARVVQLECLKSDARAFLSALDAKGV